MEKHDLQRRRELPPHPTSVGAARRLVRELLADGDREDLVDPAELVVSELVTNSVVHAGTLIRVQAEVSADGSLRVEVADSSTHAPRERHYGTLAATGRGLHLVEQLTDRWGTVTNGTGKTVWFEMSWADAGEGADPVVQEHSADDPLDEQAADVLEIVLHDAPLLLHAAWHEHAEGLLREHLLVGLDGDLAAAVECHAGASDAMALLHAQVPAPDVVDDPQHVMSRAVEPVVSADRLVLEVPRPAVPHFEVLERAMDAALVLADSGELLTPPIQPEIRAFRRWLCGEVRRQAEGLPPTAWAYDHHRAAPPDQPPVDWDPAEVSRSTRALVAADDTDQIVAVSDPAARLLGYREPDDLLGRRLIAIIPPRYHQAHLAGFTLHLSNGRDPLLGAPVVVPVLLNDGSETEVELAVTARRLPRGRRLFVAELRTPGSRS